MKYQLYTPEQKKRSATYQYAQRNLSELIGRGIDNGNDLKKMSKEPHKTTQSLKFDSDDESPEPHILHRISRSSPTPICYSTVSTNANQSTAERTTVLKNRDKSQSLMENPCDLQGRSKSNIGNSENELMETFESTSEGKTFLQIRVRSKSAVESSGSEKFESSKSVQSY